MQAALHTQVEMPRSMDGKFPKIETADDIMRVEESQWRRYGRARRRELLEVDRRKGGTNFDLNSSCSVHRYFQVAHRALDQFHEMYNSWASLEENYVMGHRMVSFLTECLPKHPDFRKPEVAELRTRSRNELVILERCLDEIALQIDEEQCNRFVADFDPIDINDDSDDDDVPDDENWIAFPSWTGDELQKGESIRKVDSPTSDTVATSGSGSVDPCDFSSSDESGEADRRLDFSLYDEPSLEHVCKVDFGRDFLERIASEDVRYETDSEADDSWAQDAESEASSISSASGITCDPARLTFRELSTRVPRVPLLKKSPNRSSKLRNKSVTQQAIDEEAVDYEIQRYLDEEVEDATSTFEASMERLRNSNTSKPRRQDERSQSSSSSGYSSAFNAFEKAEKENAPKSCEGEFILEGDAGWVQF